MSLDTMPNWSCCRGAALDILEPGAAEAASLHLSQIDGASGLRIGESTSATKAFRDAEELPDADRV